MTTTPCLHGRELNSSYAQHGEVVGAGDDDTDARCATSVMWGHSYSRKRRARDDRRATERAAGSQPPASGHAEQAVSISG